MLTESEISLIKKRLKEKFNPDKIILFGSQARADADNNSDVDLLVLTDTHGNRKRLMIEMDRALKGLNFARDIIILSLDEFERDKNIAGTIARYAYLEGKVLYEH